MPDNVPAVIATGAILAAIYNMAQPLLDPLLPKAQAQHDAATRILVVVIGATVGVVQYLLVATTIAGHDLATAALSGCAEGLTAIAAYHLAGDNLLPGPPKDNSAVSPAKAVDVPVPPKPAIVLPGAAVEQSAPPAN